MIERIGNPYLEYRQRAEECHRKAESASSPAARANFLEAESRWLAIAETYTAPEAPADADSDSEDFATERDFGIIGRSH